MKEGKFTAKGINYYNVVVAGHFNIVSSSSLKHNFFSD